jgi:hypothetical protein
MIKNLQFVCHGNQRLTLHRSHAPLVNKQFRMTLNGIWFLHCIYANFTLFSLPFILCQFHIVFLSMYLMSQMCFYAPLNFNKFHAQNQFKDIECYFIMSQMCFYSPLNCNKSRAQNQFKNIRC